jgi:hypothetical protein
MGKRHSSRQDVCILSETGDIDDMRLELDSEEGYVASPDTLEAWELDFNQQCIDAKTGRFVQIISNRHRKPLKIFKERSTLKGSTTDTIASRKQDEELAFMNALREKNKMLLWVGIIAALFAVVISIVVLVTLKRTPEGVAEYIPLLNPVAASIFAFFTQNKLVKNIGSLILRLAAAAAVKLHMPHSKKPTGVTYNRKKKKGIESEDDLKILAEVDDTGLTNCIVIVEKTGERAFPKIKDTFIPSDSLERDYKGKPCHLLGLDLEGKLWAIEPENEIKINESPKDCFIALQYEKEVNAVYALSEGTVEKMKIGFFIALCICELIILFLIISTATGGTVA